MAQTVSADILNQTPDIPRWVDARSLLLSGRGVLVDAGEGCRVVCSRADRLLIPITFELSAGLNAIADREVGTGATIVLQEVMLPTARWLLQDWDAEAATVYALAPERARDWRLPQWPTSPLSPTQLQSASGVSVDLRERLIDAQSRVPVWAALDEGKPLSFAWCSMLTETWFQVGVETVESARGRGLGRAAAMGIIVDRVLRGLRPVLRVPASNVPATRLARRLGFEAVDLHWLLTRT